MCSFDLNGLPASRGHDIGRSTFIHNGLMDVKTVDPDLNNKSDMMWKSEGKVL